jgi:hypothetical protein
MALLASACAAHAGAPVYRCGSSYSQTPCPGGKMVEATDPRSAAQRAEAARITAREKKLADALERDRLDREAGIKPAQATGFNGRPNPPEAKAEPAKKKPKKKSAKSPKAKSKAASDADIVALEPPKAKAPK